jgi:hypothetical protein
MESFIANWLIKCKLLNINYIKMFNEFRHKLEFGILLTLAFIAFCTPEYWMQWTFLSFVSLLVLLVGKIY